MRRTRATAEGSITDAKRGGKIAVVGAGVSGLAAAASLARAGARVVLFDKGRGPGGRMSTRRHESFRFDHGAQYFTVSDPRFQAEVERWRASGAAATWQTEIALLRGGRRVGTAPPRPRHVGVPGMSAVLAELGSGLDVHFATRVERLRRAGGRWLVTGEAGAVLGQFEAVLVAIPPAQAIELFEEGIPEQERLSSVAMAPCWAVMAAFDLPLAVSFDAAQVEGSPLSWLARNSSKPGRSEAECWVLHASPEWSRAQLEREASAVTSELLEAFSELTGLEAPTPAHATAHCWRFARVERALGVDCLWARRRGLGFCGDWCLGSRVEAAWLTGLAVAEQWIGDR